MSDVRPEHGMSTVVNHVGEDGHAKHAHLMPIYQTSTFGFDTVEEAGDVFAGRTEGYAYTRSQNPNMDHLANKIAYMEAIDLIRKHPASMTHSVTPKADREAAGIGVGIIRLSVGVENVEDLIADLADALAVTG